MRFPTRVLRTGTSGWNKSAKSSAKTTPSVKCDSSPAKYCAPSEAFPMMREPLAVGQFSCGRPKPVNQIPKTVASWVATTPASSELGTGCSVTHALQRGYVSSVGIDVNSPEAGRVLAATGLAGASGFIAVTEYLLFLQRTTVRVKQIVNPSGESCPYSRNCLATVANYIRVRMTTGISRVVLAWGPGR